tara:strand:- start:34 stop:489 length:456 start_codon:yes stop_codon:yes gene_type:complete
MEVEKKREETWQRLKNQVNSALELEKASLNAVCLELEQLTNTLTQLSEMVKDYHPDRLGPEKDTSIDALRRNWNFISSLELAMRRTNEQKVTIKKKEIAIREQCLNLEREVQKYETLESRAAAKRKSLDAIKERKLEDEMSSSHWLRHRYE